MYEFIDDSGYVFSLTHPPTWAIDGARELLGPEAGASEIRSLAWLVMELGR